MACPERWCALARNDSPRLPVSVKLIKCMPRRPRRSSGLRWSMRTSGPSRASRSALPAPPTAACVSAPGVAAAAGHSGSQLAATDRSVLLRQHGRRAQQRPARGAHGQPQVSTRHLSLPAHGLRSHPGLSAPLARADCRHKDCCSVALCYVSPVGRSLKGPLPAQPID